MTVNHPFIDNLLLFLSKPAPQWTEEQDVPLLEPFTYIASSPGKGFRSKLAEAVNDWFQVPSPQFNAIERAAKLLHDASLLVDDIEDNSELRRGKPVAHKVFGVPQTINAANYVYFLAFQEVLRIPGMDQVEEQYNRRFDLLCQKPSGSDRRFFQIFTDELLAGHRGQGQELIWRDYLQCPTEEEFVQMVRDKTGSPFRLLFKLMMACSTVDIDVNYLPFADLLGIWFQIRDDYMNLQSKSYSDQKGFAEDLEEGKFSFPIVHSIGATPNSKYLTNVLHQRTKDPVLKQHTISYLKEETNSFEYTLSVIRSLEAQMRAELARLGGSRKLEALLDEYVV